VARSGKKLMDKPLELTLAEIRSKAAELDAYLSATKERAPEQSMAASPWLSRAHLEEHAGRADCARRGISDGVRATPGTTR